MHASCELYQAPKFPKSIPSSISQLNDIDKFQTLNRGSGRVDCHQPVGPSH